MALLDFGLPDPRTQGLLAGAFKGMELSGPSLMPRSLGQIIGGAGTAGLNTFQEAQKNELQNSLVNFKLRAMQDEQSEKVKQRAALANFEATLPPEQASMFRADPKGFLENYNKKYVVGGSLVSGDGTPTYTAPRDPKTHTDAQGVLRYSEGPNIGQVVPGFGTPKTPEGFTVDANGNLQPIEAYWAQKIKVAQEGRPQNIIENYPNPIPVVGADGKPRMVQFGKAGAQREVPFTPYQEPRPTTEAERVAGGYASRMLASERLMEEIGPVGFPNETTAVAGAVGPYAQRRAMTPEQQQFDQAARDWIRAKLRKESGAVIGKEEEDNEYRTYFPMPGDGPEVIAQKAQARRIASEGMVTSAGKEAPKIDRTPVKARSKQFKLDNGQSVLGTFEPATGKYFVVRDGKKFYIEE
jgi:hypothetical protein